MFLRDALPAIPNHGCFSKYLLLLMAQFVYLVYVLQGFYSDSVPPQDILVLCVLIQKLELALLLLQLVPRLVVLLANDCLYLSMIGRVSVDLLVGFFLLRLLLVLSFDHLSKRTLRNSSSPGCTSALFRRCVRCLSMTLIHGGSFLSSGLS